MEKKRVLDVEILDLYDSAFVAILPNQGESWANAIGEMRWQLVKAMPKNEDAIKECLKACLSKDDFEHAKQVSMHSAS